jgi:1-acyl-sn-glycerol-3-phosphate acyltransferase
MSDATYRWTTRLIRPIYLMCSRSVVLHADRAAIPGGYILAANHLSPMDAFLLVGHTPRMIDFMSIVELRRSLLARLFFSLYNVFYLDRRQRDPGAVRAAVRRLQSGRVIGLFPEGRIRSHADSVLRGGAIDPGVARMAQIAGVPVIPAVVLGGEHFNHARGWLPIRRTRYGVIFGPPMHINPNLSATHACDSMVRELQETYQALGRELAAKLS